MLRRASILLAVVAALAASIPGGADHNADQHSPNLERITTFDDKGTYSSGTDIAFWENLAVFGNQDPGGFRLIDISNPVEPTLVSNFVCAGGQSDVSIWEDLVFVSIDGGRTGPECEAEAAGDTDEILGTAWAGIRVVSIADPRAPVQVAAVDTDCGSHTHTLVPDTANDRVLIYVQSYPLTEETVDCNPITHRKISVIEVPLDAPEKAAVVSTPSVSPAVGCHDVTVFMERKLAAAACITESQMWDISDPENPIILSHIINPLVTIHHGTGFAWDGNTMVLADELAGAITAAGCLSGGAAPLGALWFYDVSDPSSPVETGSFVIPRLEASITCTAHNFNVIPLRDGRDVLVTAWYEGGTAVVDFTDPASPQEIAHYLPLEGEPGISWSSYFYDGYIYANNLGSRGVDVLRLNESFLAASVPLGRMNAQAQEQLPGPGPAPPAPGPPPPLPKPTVLGGRQLAGTGVGSWLWPGVALVLAAAAAGSVLRRSGA